MKIKIGDIVKVKGGKRKYSVQAIDGKYVFLKGLGWGQAKDTILIRHTDKGEGK